MTLTASPLFAGLDQEALNDILGIMKLRCYATSEHICREGDISDRMYLIESGVVDVLIGEGPTARVITHLRRGDIFGEIGLLSNEPRSASVLAAMPTLVLELDRGAFTDVINRHPQILLNIVRVLVNRQKRSLRLLAQSRQGEFTLLLIGRGTEPLVQEIIAGCQRACPHGVLVLDLSNGLSSDKIARAEKTVPHAITVLDNLVGTSTPIISVSYCDQPDLASLIRYVDRVALLGTKADLEVVSDSCAGSKPMVDIFLMGALIPDGMGEAGNVRLCRTLGRDETSREIGWIARHLTRTKLGLALGAGGAKCFAHIGVLDVLERSGYVVDFVAGSSIGGLVGALMGLGMQADEIDVQLKQIWRPEHVDLLASLSPEGVSVGLGRVMATIEEIFADRSMPALSVPLSILTAGLQEGEPVPLRDWPVCKAIRAGLSIPGLALPYRHNSQRLVDAVCLTPVPATYVRDMGADIVVSVNLLSRQVVTDWPTEAAPMPAYKRRQTQILDPVVESLMMLQIDTSVRNAAQADIALTPGFEPSSWRNFCLAERFREAGREIAEAELAISLRVAGPSQGFPA